MKDKYTESLYKQDYSDWISDQKLPSHDGYYLTGEDLEFVYDAQQSKINELLERLKECESALKFYADKNNYIELCVEGSTGNPRITEGDFVDCVIDHADRGYAKAREYFKKYEGKNG